MNNLRIIGTIYNKYIIHCLIITVYTKTCICKELTLPKAVVLGLNLKAHGRSWQLIFAVSEKKQSF